MVERKISVSNESRHLPSRPSPTVEPAGLAMRRKSQEPCCGNYSGERTSSSSSPPTELSESTGNGCNPLVNHCPPPSPPWPSPSSPLGEVPRREFGAGDGLEALQDLDHRQGVELAILQQVSSDLLSLLSVPVPLEQTQVSSIRTVAIGDL
jgi:hypothetical protein